ncbi:TetR/AcrR family transcriptional regulator [Niallia sp.]|uniref:TetR/AcrR family transcriptional regulator n=1 Tax=Niallia sp. TaxID=2837523 RepID=UPI00289D9A65|nr:TetR/AcrR family transcriptional regulator [Niallia sp.]
MKVKNTRNTPTKQAIEDAFSELLEKKDIEDITIKNITERANVNRATFYAHYQDKYQLFDNMIYESASKTVKRYTNHTNEWNEKQIESLYKAVEEYLSRVKESCPYSYLKLFPLLREKMLDVLRLHLKSTLNNEITEFNLLLFSRIVYDAAEISVVESISLSNNEIIEEVQKLVSFSFQ